MFLRNGMAGVMRRYLFYVLPAVDAELAKWISVATNIPCIELRQQALASIRHKTFHCQGGTIYVAGSGPYRSALLRFIVALQTISDYLDNLCDRSGICDASGFQLLHQAMLDAVACPSANTPPASYTNTQAGYYDLYPYQDDGGYLAALVESCQQALAALPHYPVVAGHVQHLVQLYCDLQVKKHIAHAERLPQLTTWFANEWTGEEDLRWQEFAAASGSTLGVFALCHAATGSKIPDPDRILRLYFPWMTSLHILLDYFIDLHEDAIGGDLNFVSYYADLAEAVERMSLLLQRARGELAHQDEHALHATALYGLLALYLTDGKVAKQGQQMYARSLLNAGGSRAWGLYIICRWYRRFTLGHVRGNEIEQAPPEEGCVGTAELR